MRRLLSTLLLLGLCACPPPPPVIVPPPVIAPPPLPRVPAGCEASLAGTYRHAEDESFRYDVTDDGTEVHITAYRQFGATRQAIDNSAAEITLRRAPEGFRGGAQTERPTLSGSRTCAVTFPYEVTACAPGTLTLRTVHEVRISELCEPDDPLHPDFVVNVLVRIEPPDAGAVDAGAPEADAGSAMDAGAADAGPMIDAGAPEADAGAVTRSVADGG